MNLLLDVATDKRQIEKNARSAVNLLAFAIIFSTALSYIFPIVTAFILPLISELITNILIGMGQSRMYAVIFAQNFIHSDGLTWFLSIVSSILCTFLPFVVLSKRMLKMTSEEAAPLNGKIPMSFPFIYCSARMSATVVSMFASWLFSVFFPSVHNVSGTEITKLYGNSTSAPSLFLAFLSMCVIASLVEEFVYRGVIYGYLKKYGSYFAAFSSSLIFGFAHATVDQIAYAFIFGLVLCEVTKRTGNLKTAIIIHFINNFVAYLTGYLMPYLGLSWAAVIFNMAHGIISGVFAIIGFIMLFKYRNNEKDTPNEEYNVPMHCFFCVGTVFVIVSSVVDMITVLFANG